VTLLSDRPQENVVGAAWDHFVMALRRGSRTPLIRAWDPGDHVACVGPTGEGKTTVAVGLLGLRKWVLALDPKGEDTTLAKSGFLRIKNVPPPRRIQQDVAEGKPAHLIVGGAARTAAEDARLELLMREALDYARHSGGWTVYVDEFQLLADQRMFRLGPRVERMLITARKDGTSVVTSFQAMAWVPRAAVRQATAFVVMFPTRDRDMIEATARAMGRDRHQVGAVMDKLPEYHVLIIPRKVADPLIITSARELK
jgi:hypothetical protein